MLNYPTEMLTEQQIRCIPNVHFELIPIDQLVSDQEYQRPVSEKHVLATAAEFDVYQINPVKVSRRDGINYIVDGQHTCTIVAEVSGSRSTPVWCMVFDDLEYKTEASVFADQQKHTKSLSPFEIFHAHIEAGDEKQQLIQKTCQSYGLEISGKRVSANHICAIASLEKIYDRYGFEILDSTLRLCVGTWQGQTNSMSGRMLMAIARLIDTYGDNLNEAEFRDQVGKQPITYVIRLAKERDRGHLGYAEALIEIYNGSKKKNGLNPMGLHGGPLTFMEEGKKKKKGEKSTVKKDEVAEETENEAAKRTEIDTAEEITEVTAAGETEENDLEESDEIEETSDDEEDE